MLSTPGYKHELFDGPQENGLHIAATRAATFPRRFEPTIYPLRLGDPQKVKKPSTVFVCSMGDLLGDWVPRPWIELVINATTKAPQHKYFFLTKNPARYAEFEWPENCWLGTTVTGPQNVRRSRRLVNDNDGKNKTWLSVEPLLGSVEGIFRHEWIIVGSQTGSKNKTIPEFGWLNWLAQSHAYAENRVGGKMFPLYMKPSLADVWPSDLIQEFPEGIE